MRRLEGMDPHVAAVFVDLVARLRSCGALIEEVELPRRREVRDAHAVKVLGEARSVYADFWPLQDTALGEAARQALGIAQGIDAAALARADTASRKVRSDLTRVFARVDAILTPTLPVQTPAVGVRRVALDGEHVPLVVALTAETAIANLTGCPALVVPLSGNAGPVRGASVQLLAASGKDAELFEYGSHLEAMLEGAPEVVRAPATS